MHAVIEIEKWAPIEEGSAGQVKTSATVAMDGQASVIEDLVELLRKAGYAIR